jgi:hypothetical protein
MRGSTPPLLTILCVLSGSGALVSAAAQTPETTLKRALDRAVLRVNSRSDLQNHLGPGFDRDSFDVRAFKGLRRADDSTVLGWFTGFATFLNGTDDGTCEQLSRLEPTGTALAAVPSMMDSTAIEDWMTHWEHAVAASFLAEARPPVNEEEVMMALLALMVKLPGAQVESNAKPSSKPRKPDGRTECGTMREFFNQAIRMDDPVRMTLFRGLADTMNEKSVRSAPREE